VNAQPVIGVWGHFADANLGDDACPTALLENLTRLVPTARFVLFCRFPSIAQARWSWPAHPVHRLARGQTSPWEPPTAGAPDGTRALSRWRMRARRIGPLRLAVRAMRAVLAVARALPAEALFLWHSYRRLRDVDVLVVTGSNPLFDFFGGFWEYPYSVWKWATLARLCRTRLAFVSVGAGPIVSARSGELLARVLNRADYVSFRDEGSRRLMREYGYDGPGAVYPDLAHSLPFRPPPVTRAPAERLRVGINPMIVHNSFFWPVHDPAVQQRYIQSLAHLAAALLAEGYDVFLYGTQKDDRVPATAVQAAMPGATPEHAAPPFVMPASIDELLELCAGADLLVTTRFHGAVFGALTARPTLAICYQPKTREVLEGAGLEAHTIALEAVTPERLRIAFERLRAQRQLLAAELQKHGLDLRVRLDQQYRDVAALVQPVTRHTTLVPLPSRKPEAAESRS